MRKVALIAAASIIAASLPLLTTSASAQKPLAGGGVTAAPQGGGAAAGGGGMAAGRGGAPVGGGGVAAGGTFAKPTAPIGAFRGGGGTVASPSIGTAPQTSWTARPGWTGPWAGHHHHRRFIGPGIAFGTGFGLGAYAASPYYYGGYYDDPYYYDAQYDDGVIVGSTAASPEDVAYCQRRYRSYDVSSGTFLGKDGRRHPCP